jgi:TetR/AcrR family transcriptional regulator, transcriptional repressor for nem operon
MQSTHGGTRSERVTSPSVILTGMRTSAPVSNASSRTKNQARSRGAGQETPERILDVAERLVQTRGFNGMSYADIAETLGVTKASLHYHFPTKADLGARLISRYEEAFVRALANIDATETDPGARLRAYVGIYQDVLRKNRMCLCGMLAAEHGTLPREMRTRLGAFFDANESWLVGVLGRGRSAGALSFDGPASAKARMLIGSLEGAMLLARSYGQVERFTQVAAQLLDAIEARAPRRRRPSAS